MKIAATFWLAIVMFALAGSAFGTNYVVTKTADTNDGTCDADCSLREAVGAANANVADDVIIFALPLFSSSQTITLTGGELVIANSGSLSIYGPGANRLTVSGNNASRIWRSMASSVSTISGMTLTAGNGVSSVNNNTGGAIQNDAGTMTLLDLYIFNNTTSGVAGGVRNSGTNSVMTVNRCVFQNNTSMGSSAGGIQNFSTSTLTILNSTFTGNVSGGGTVGGGAMQANGTVSVANSTFVGNVNNASGGGGAINSNGSLLLLTNVTITGNVSTANGGGLHRGTTNANGFIRNSVIARNNGAIASPDVTNSAGGLASQGNNIIGAVGTSTGWVGSDITPFTDGYAALAFNGGYGMTQLPFPGSAGLNAGQNCVVDLTCSANNPPLALGTDERGAPRLVGSNVDIGAVEADANFAAILPSARAGVAYDFQLVPSASGFMYFVNSGNFGGLSLLASSQVRLQGTPPSAGTFDTVLQTLQTSGPPLSTTQRYRINVFGSDPNSYFITGRIVDSAGQPVSNAYVSLSTFDGSTYNGKSSPMGYFRIDSIPAGTVGTLAVSATKKGLTFSSMIVTVADVIENLEIRAQP